MLETLDYTIRIGSTLASQYTDLSIFRFISRLCLRSTLRLLLKKLPFIRAVRDIVKPRLIFSRTNGPSESPAALPPPPYYRTFLYSSLSYTILLKIIYLLAPRETLGGPETTVVQLIADAKPSLLLGNIAIL